MIGRFVDFCNKRFDSSLSGQQLLIILGHCMFIVKASILRAVIRATEADTSLLLCFKFMVKTVPIIKIITNDLNNIFSKIKIY